MIGLLADLMPAATTLRSVTVNAFLFVACLPANRLKAMVASAKGISDILILQLDSGASAPSNKIRYWAIDEGGICAMLGTIQDEMFTAVDGDDAPHTIQVSAKVLHQCVGAFDGDRDMEIRLLSNDGRRTLELVQTRPEIEEADRRTISVVDSSSTPKVPIIPKGAYASVDLKRLNKVLNGLKQNTDVVTVSIRPDNLSVSASTKRMQDGWSHPTVTTGKADGLFSVKDLKRVVANAKELDSNGEIYLTEDFPLRVESICEDARAIYWLAGREVMK